MQDRALQLTIRSTGSTSDELIRNTIEAFGWMPRTSELGIVLSACQAHNFVLCLVRRQLLGGTLSQRILSRSIMIACDTGIREMLGEADNKLSELEASLREMADRIDRFQPGLSHRNDRVHCTAHERGRYGYDS